MISLILMGLLVTATPAEPRPDLYRLAADVRQSPADATIRLRYAEALIEERRTIEAVSELRAVLRNAGANEETRRKAVQKLSALFRDQARRHAENGDRVRAERWLSGARRFDRQAGEPEFVPSPDPRVIVALSEARTQIAAARPTDALDALARLSGPLPAAVHAVRAEALLSLGREAEAVRSMDRAIAADSAGAEVRRLRAQFSLIEARRLAAGQRFAEAVAALDRSGIYGPEYSALRGEWCVRLGDTTGAIENFEKAVTGGSATAARANLVRLYAATGMPEKIVERFGADALPSMPTDPALLVRLARLSITRGDSASASLLYRKTIERDSRLAEPWLAMAQMRFSAGEFEKAAFNAQQAHQRGEPRALDLLFEALLRADRISEATRLAERVSGDSATSTAKLKAWRDLASATNATAVSSTLAAAIRRREAPPTPQTPRAIAPTLAPPSASRPDTRLISPTTAVASKPPLHKPAVATLSPTPAAPSQPRPLVTTTSAPPLPLRQPESRPIVAPPPAATQPAPDSPRRTPPSHAPDPLTLASLHLDRDNPEAALALLEKIPVDAINSRTRHLKALALARLDQIPEMIALRVPDDPSIPAVWRAELAAARGDSTTLNALLSTIPPGSRPAPLLERHARLLIKARNLAGAENICNELIRRTPSAAGWRMKIEIALARSQREAAVRIGRTALLLHPGDAEVRIALGKALWTSGRFGEAYGTLRPAARLTRDPRVKTISLAAAGAAALGLGLFETAISHLEPALAAAREQASTRLVHTIAYNLALAERRRGESARAVGILEEADLRDDESLLIHAASLADLGRGAEALAMLEGASSRSPIAMLNYAILLRQNNMVADAVRVLRALAEVWTSEPLVKYYLGRTLEDAGELTEARAQYAAAADTERDSDLAMVFRKESIRLLTTAGAAKAEDDE